MSKSLEALDKLCKIKIYQKEASAYDYLGKEIYKEEINAIKQDLEEYEEYKDQWSSDTHCWIEDNIGTFYVIDKDKEIECRLYELPIFNELLANVDKLLYENQELKELQELNKQGLWNLKQENKKLKKTIEILKDKVAD